MTTDPNIRWPQLVKELTRLSSASALAKRIGVQDREVRRWVQGTARPQGDSAERLVRECEERGINWRDHQRPLPVYDYRNTYDANLRDGPRGVSANHNPCLLPIPTKFLGHDVNSPIGLSSSPLTATSDWIAVLARYGYDVITAKTVRTQPTKPHPFPNWVHLPGLTKPVAEGKFPDSVLAQLDLPEDLSLAQSSANSFGMPSGEPDVWIEDLIKAKTHLLQGQMLIASIVGTADSPADDLAKDFVDCGLRAAEAHPHAIEVNFSCPNVYGEEGSLCNNPEKAGEICRLLTAQIKIPILAKICYMPDGRLRDFFLATYRYVSGFTAINTIPSLIMADGQRPEQMFSGSKRARAGVSGSAIREYATSAARSLSKLTHQHRRDLENIGVGGICCADDVKARIETGVRVTQLCTAVNLNPLLGQQIRQQLGGTEASHPRARFDGETVTFTDATVKAAFKATSEVCHELGVPFDRGLNALRRQFLDRYERERGALDPIKSAARGKIPTKDEIEQWIRFEIAQSGRR